MQITKVETEKLIPYARNARTHTSEQVSQICASIKEFGFTNPVLIDEDNVIIAGHGRVMASQRMNLDTVPCVVLKHLTDAQKKAYVIADNQLALNAGWNEELLRVEIEELDGLNFNLELLGFNDIDKYLDTEQGLTDEDEVPEPPKEPKSKLGDVYQLGEHRLMCGDSVNLNDVDKLVNNNKIDLMFTDPPYNVAFNGRSGKFDVIKNDNLDKEKFNEFIHEFINTFKTLNINTYYICCNWAFYGVLQQILEPKACIVWAKNVFGLGKGYRHQHEFILFDGFIDASITNESDLWEIKKDVNYKHPTQKPVSLSARAIKNSTKQRNGVLDLFGGSGSTMLACEKNNRKCYMMELDPKYVDVIIERWQNYTGKHAVHADSGKKFDEMINRDINT